MIWLDKNNNLLILGINIYRPKTILRMKREERGLMKKSDLVDLLANKEGLAEATAKRIVDMVFDGFTEELKNGGRIEIRGFGSFTVKEYKSYTGRNPKSGKNIAVQPKKLPFFKVGKELKERVDEVKK